jgi:hypothetical protein
MLHRQWARGVRTASFGIIAEGGRLVETPVALARNYAHHYNLAPPPVIQMFSAMSAGTNRRKAKIQSDSHKINAGFSF